MRPLLCRRRDAAEDVELAVQPRCHHDREGLPRSRPRPCSPIWRDLLGPQLPQRRGQRKRDAEQHCRPTWPVSPGRRAAPPITNARRSPRSPRAHSHRLSAPSVMNSPKLSGCPKNGVRRAGTVTSRAGSERRLAAESRIAADEPGQWRSKRTNQPHRQPRTRRRSAPKSHTNGTWTSAARGIQWPLDEIGRVGAEGNMPPTSTKFQM